MDFELGLVTDPYACMKYIVSPLAGLGGGILWRPPAYSLFIIQNTAGMYFRYKIQVCILNSYFEYMYLKYCTTLSLNNLTPAIAKRSSSEGVWRTRSNLE